MEDKRKHKQFGVDMQEKLDEDKFMKHHVFSNEATFHTKSVSIMFVFGVKKIPMPQLSM